MTALAETLTLPARARRSKSVVADSSLWLEVGEAVRYQGLGAGHVIEHQERDFRGSKCVFAVIRFPHREMTAQIPLGDDGLVHKLRPVLPVSAVKKLLALVAQPGQALSRTWDDREEAGTKRLRDGSPAEWAELLRDYASARKGGMAITASDADLVRETTELLAAEYCCAAGCDYDKALDLVQGAYQTAAA